MWLAEFVAIAMVGLFGLKFNKILCQLILNTVAKWIASKQVWRLLHLMKKRNGQTNNQSLEMQQQCIICTFSMYA
jgi:hypothetical protein